jgi:trehalose synthase
MWKGKPVVGGAVGGIAEQIQDGVNGYLVHSIEGCAHAIRQLLGDRSRRHAMGEAAREQARRNALITRHLSDYLQMLLLRTTMATG